MFDLTPVSTSNLFTLVQILAVIGGFFFSWRSLEATRKSLEVAGQNLAIGTRNAQAQLFNQMVVQGRDLQYKFMEIFHGGSSEEDMKQKQQHYTGTLISYYSSCFELKSVLPLPSNVEKLLEAELSELLREKQVREKWDEVKHLHSKEFVAYADNLRGI